MKHKEASRYQWRAATILMCGTDGTDQDKETDEQRLALSVRSATSVAI